MRLHRSKLDELENREDTEATKKHPSHAARLQKEGFGGTKRTDREIAAFLPP